MGHEREVLPLDRDLVVGEVGNKERQDSRAHVGQAQKTLFGKVDDVLVEGLLAKRRAGTAKRGGLVGIVARGAHEGLARGLQGVLCLVGVSGNHERRDADHIGGDRHRHGHLALVIGVLNDVARAGHLVLRLDGK